MWSGLRFAVSRRTFLVLRTTGVLTLTGVTALSSVVDTPLEGGAVGRAWLVAFLLLERPGIFHCSYSQVCSRVVKKIEVPKTEKVWVAPQGIVHYCMIVISAATNLHCNSECIGT